MEIFWLEAFQCFTKGMLSGGIIAIVLTTIVFKLFPIPNLKWQFAMTLVASCAALAMLNLHCASAHIGHIICGHWFTAVPIVIFTILWQRLLFWILLRKIRN